MALFKTVNVTLALDILRIWSADDRYRGVEPYVVPIFFKVDGERYLVSLRIAHAQAPRPGTTEQPATGQISLSVDTFADGILPKDATTEQIQEDNPLIWVPQGQLLGRGSLDAGEQVVMRDVSFTSNLIPIALRIDLRNVYVNAAEAFQGLFVSLQGELHNAINTVFISVDDFIGDLFGLDEVFDRCPAAELGTSGFLENIDAQFKAMIPGTIGGVFVCMENDAFDENLTQELRSSLEDEVASALNNIVNALNLDNAIPEKERFADDAATVSNIASDLKWPVIADALGATVASALSGSLGLGLYGILTALSWTAGGKDDTIGVVTVTFDHSNLGPPGSLTLRSQVLTTEDDNDDNRWDLSYTLTVNSVA